MKILPLFILTIVLTIASCIPDVPESVEGCTDINSLNYNPDADIDDGSCQYISDLYAGVYLVSDTSYYTDPNTQQVVTYTGQYTFSITKTGNAKVNVSAFGSCNTLMADVSATLLSFTNMIGCNLQNVVVQKSGDDLKFTYNEFVGINRYTRGIAKRQ